MKKPYELTEEEYVNEYSELLNMAIDLTETYKSI